MATELEINNLKADWTQEPIWDIEETEGFEEHREELRRFHDEMSARWESERRERDLATAARVGLDGNAEVGAMLNALLSRIADLENQVKELSYNA